jgi:hypothetical protein
MLKIISIFFFFFSDSCSGIHMPSCKQHFLHIPHHFSTSMLLLLYWSGIQVFTTVIVFNCTVFAVT